MKGRDRALNIPVPDHPKISEPSDYDTWPSPTTKFDWPKPFALGLGKWAEWKTEMKSKYPIRFFFRETLPLRWTVNITYPIRNAKWWVLHRIHPKHRYHKVDTGLPPGYYDPDILIFESTFALLCRFVKYNIKHDIINWDGDDHHKTAWKEMNELVYWYTTIRPTREDDLDRLRPEGDIAPIMLGNTPMTPEVQAYKDYLALCMQRDAEWAEEDEKNLIRVIKLRSYLWYA